MLPLWHCRWHSLPAPSVCRTLTAGKDDARLSRSPPRSHAPSQTSPDTSSTADVLHHRRHPESDTHAIHCISPHPKVHICVRTHACTDTQHLTAFFQINLAELVYLRFSSSIYSFPKYCVQSRCSSHQLTNNVKAMKGILCPHPFLIHQLSHELKDTTPFTPALRHQNAGTDTEQHITYYS